MLDVLAQDIRDRKVILFAGAGLSRPLGLPTWEELIRHMAKELGFDPDVLVGPGADYLQVAEFYKVRKGTIGALRSWMDKNWNVDEDKLRASKVHKQIVDLGFPLIYTTNYDNNIERAFEIHGKEFSKVSAVFDLTDTGVDRTEIIKFHGDFSDDNSLVITETDYFERLEFESPLDLRLRSDVLSRSILFIGYSLKDLNLRLLLYKLKKTWEGTVYADRRPPAYIFLTRPDPVQEEVLKSRGILPIVSNALYIDDALPCFFHSLMEKVQGTA